LGGFLLGEREEMEGDIRERGFAGGLEKTMRG